MPHRGHLGLLVGSLQCRHRPDRRTRRRLSVLADGMSRIGIQNQSKEPSAPHRRNQLVTGRLNVVHNILLVGDYTIQLWKRRSVWARLGARGRSQVGDLGNNAADKRVSHAFKYVHRFITIARNLPNIFNSDDCLRTKEHLGRSRPSCLTSDISMTCCAATRPIKRHLHMVDLHIDIK